MLKSKRFGQHYVKGLFEAKDLFMLWVKRLVVAKNINGTFTMPAVLPELPQENLSEHRLDIHSSKIIPVAIYYLSLIHI